MGVVCYVYLATAQAGRSWRVAIKARRVFDDQPTGEAWASNEVEKIRRESQAALAQGRNMHLATGGKFIVPTVNDVGIERTRALLLKQVRQELPPVPTLPARLA